MRKKKIKLREEVACAAFVAALEVFEQAGFAVPSEATYETRSLVIALHHLGDALRRVKP